MYIFLNRYVNHGPRPRAWPVKDCRMTVLDRDFLARGMDYCKTEFFLDGLKWAMRDYKYPHFFLFISCFTYKKWKRESEKKVIRVTSPWENERSSGDDDSSSKDDDSSSKDDDLSSGGVLIWCYFYLLWNLQFWFGVWFYLIFVFIKLKHWLWTYEL